ncbi:MAG: phosphoribosylanthranilate isomerase [Chitinophagaceae bacterium]
MKIKVCGITSFGQLQEIQNLGVEYAGMIFYEGSKRNAITKLNSEKDLIKNSSINKVGVFVNADYDTIIKTIDDYGLLAVQLHGDETDEFCMELMDLVKVIKVFKLKDQQNIDELVESFQNVCHFFLFDTSSGEEGVYGGTGEKFNWDILAKSSIRKPFFLSGGIGPEDADKVRLFKHDYLYGIDINSRFEKEPGVKDINLISEFIKATKR